MKHTYSLANIKPKKFIKSEIKNLNFGLCESPIFSGFCSPKSKKKNDKTKEKSRTNTNSKVNLNFLDSKNKSNMINIRLNIKSEIINNNYNEHKKSLSKKEKLEKIIETKDKVIEELQRKILNTKYQIELRQTKNNLKNSIEKFENPDNFLNEKMNKIQKEHSKLATIKTSSVISKNVRQYFKNFIFKNSKSLSKTATPTSIVSSGNKNQLTLSNINNNISLNSHLFTNKNCNGNYLDIENNLTRSPRYDRDTKATNKSNSLLSSKESKKKLSQRNHHSREKSLNIHKYINNNNSCNCTNTNCQENTSEFERIKIRTKEVMINYVKYINDKQT